ncbi:MAG: agmatinase [Candidatus Daviesbacteria bacterium]|nr:agmatinase [Candidatus Daviesbacteria bacterium]
MKKLIYERLEPFNFGGLEGQDYKSAKVIIFPVPYSSTTYWNPGTKDGPRALIEASRHLETWDLELKKDISKCGIYTLDSLAPSKNSPQEVMDQIEKVVSQILKDKKFPLIIGGEHSITYGGVKAFAKNKNFSVLQFDAHTDLRAEFEGTKYHHGAVMRRIYEDLKIPVTQVGIRSVSEEEVKYIKKSKKENIFYAPSLPIEEIVASLKENVYISFDLDFLDPSIMPSTGTPEPGGFFWYQALELLKAVANQKNIVGADIVELSPIPSLPAPDFLAAKLVYKIIGYIFSSLV